MRSGPVGRATFSSDEVLYGRIGQKGGSKERKRGKLGSGMAGMAADMGMAGKPMASASSIIAAKMLPASANIRAVTANKARTFSWKNGWNDRTIWHNGTIATIKAK